MKNNNLLTAEFAKKEHFEKIYEIEESSFTIPWSKKSLEKDMFFNDLSIYIVALIEEKVVGYISLWHIEKEGHIMNIAVLEKYRNKGIGNFLIKKVDKVAKEKNMKGLTLEVRINNKFAQKLYLKNGYKIEGIRKNYYSDTKEDAIIMWKHF